MKISELKPGQGNIDVEGTIKEIGEPRVFNKFGKELKVSNAVLEDDSGNIKLTLWNDDVDRFKEGDKIKIVNGYVNEFQGEAQLTSGKFGNMEKVGAGESTGDSDSPKEEKPEEAGEEVAGAEGEAAEAKEESGGEEPEPENKTEF